MNEFENQQSQDSIEQLFSQANQSEPVFEGDNFTKMVVNQLPSNVHRVNHRSFLFDALGFLLGAGIVASVFKVKGLISLVEALLPSTIVISLPHILMASALFSAFSVLAWWCVERAD